MNADPAIYRDTTCKPSNEHPVIVTSGRASHPSITLDGAFTPLAEDHIRLLSFDARTTTNDIHLNVSSGVDRSTARYYALSYCWGDLSHTRSITLNGYKRNITENLWRALSSIWTHHLVANAVDLQATIIQKTRRLLWIDAICINQGDLNERSNQVQMMWKIYSEAQLVLVWLGPEADGTASVVRSLELFGDVASMVRNSSTPLGDTSAVTRLANREYFERTWAIPEYINAARMELLCGRYKFDEERLLYFVVTLSLAQQCRGFLVLGTGRRNRYKPFSSDSRNSTERDVCPSGGVLEGCLELFVATACTDPRDRVFAMIGHPAVRESSNLADFRADYSLKPSDLAMLVLGWNDGTDQSRWPKREVAEKLYYPDYSVILRRPTFKSHRFVEIVFRSLGVHKPVDSTNLRSWAWSVGIDVSTLPEFLTLSNGRRVNCMKSICSLHMQRAFQYMGGRPSSCWGPKPCGLFAQLMYEDGPWNVNDGIRSAWINSQPERYSQYLDEETSGPSPPERRIV